MEWGAPGAWGMSSSHYGGVIPSVTMLLKHEWQLQMSHPYKFSKGQTRNLTLLTRIPNNGPTICVFEGFQALFCPTPHITSPPLKSTQFGPLTDGMTSILTAIFLAITRSHKKIHTAGQHLMETGGVGHSLPGHPGPLINLIILSLRLPCHGGAVRSFLVPLSWAIIWFVHNIACTHWYTYLHHIQSHHLVTLFNEFSPFVTPNSAMEASSN